MLYVLCSVPLTICGIPLFPVLSFAQRTILGVRLTMQRRLRLLTKFLFALLVLFAALWLWQVGKEWLTFQHLRNVAGRLGARIVSVTPSPAVIVQRLQALNRWETAQMVSQHLVEVRSESTWLPSFLFGERLLLIAQAEVVAGINMRRLSPENVQVQGDRIVLTLPPPQILSVRLNEVQTRVFTRERGWLVFTPDSDLERRARLQAIQEARQAALRSDLLPFAMRRAEENLTAFLRALGFQEVEIRWQHLLPEDTLQQRSEVSGGWRR